MSFSDDIKQEIIDQQYKSACCRRALLNGILFSRGNLSSGEIVVNLENDRLCEYTAALIREFFNKDAEISMPKSGGRRRILSFKSPAAERYLSATDAGTSEYFTQKCASCRQSFLRGVFLASGRMTDPKKQYRLEFAPSARFLMLKDYFAENELAFSVAKRRGEEIIYTGNSTTAEDFFAAVGLNSTAFLLMNSKIEGEFKNAANRIRNCETNNIMKTVSAAARSIDAIEALESANLLSTLPEELEMTARLRIQYKDYSLARLAAEFSPPISKPGLSHRLNKIVELSESLLGKKN